jgi:hypothetical protein
MSAEVINEDSKHEYSHAEQVEVGLGPDDAKLTVNQAIAADHAEYEMGVWPALKLYKAAVFWSIRASMRIVRVSSD